MMGVFAMVAALVPLGCASKVRTAEVPPLRDQTPPTDVSAAAPVMKDSPDAKFPDAPLPAAPAAPSSGKEEGGGPDTQETAPAEAPAQDRRETTPPAEAPTQGQRETTPPEVKTPKAPAAAVPPATPRGKNTVAPTPGKQAVIPPLDLKSLEKRLRDTKAIGVFTKLSLKNQVDDLLSQVRTFHEGKQRVTLTTLRESYDLLIMKVLSLLQDTDAPLARDIAASREAIWSLLADPVKFATLT
jgi:hypothetical protein